ncbi:hypothetical protein A0H81_00899 [Grifola frondosa]|uniref:F-box domain-containing protein n=1 Tax=Grifola frondosa TaxID=5627 RepID=A0A1C7MT39_GRIFR|nr:hypothetical protein A0H81_00899 [Grifola frondosa]
MNSRLNSARPWNTLPVEMKLSIVDLLNLADVKSFATVNREAYTLSVPTLFRAVNISSYEALQSYLATIPESYHIYIRQLSICTTRDISNASATSVSDALVELLSQCTQLEQLTLNLAASVSKTVIPASKRAFGRIHCSLHPPSIPAVARSHHPLGSARTRAYRRLPFIPLVSGDEDIPDHFLLGAELRLPSLLRLPTLKNLRIRDTHLGDSQWSCTPVHCSLEVLDLGSCYHESLDFNRIYFRVCEEQGNAAQAPAQAPPHAPLPVENVVDTLTTLSGSPVEQLSVQCHEDDVVDMCSALEDFLSLRAERGEKEFYQHLTEIVVDTVSDLYEDPVQKGAKGRSAESLSPEQADAVRRLQEFCRDIRLGGGMRDPLRRPARPDVSPADEITSEKTIAQQKATRVVSSKEMMCVVRCGARCIRGTGVGYPWELYAY